MGQGIQQDRDSVLLLSLRTSSNRLCCHKVRQGFGSISGVHHACNLSGELIRLSIISHLQSVFAMDFDISQTLEVFGKDFTCLLASLSDISKMMREYSDVVTIAIPTALAIVAGIFCRYHTKQLKGKD